LSNNGWTLRAHPLFLDQVERLIAQVEEEKKKDPENYKSAANAKTLAAINKIAFTDIPADPTNKNYRQGDTLGDNHKHWFRAKFGKGRFRLFFRYDSKAKIIIYAWVNDENSLRTYGKKTDAYTVFKGMLDNKAPPTDWEILNKECLAKGVAERFEKIRPQPSENTDNQ